MTNVNPNGAVPFFEEYLTDLSLRTIIYRGGQLPRTQSSE